MITATMCRECDTPIPYAGNGRPNLLCSDECRAADKAKPWFLRTPDHEVGRVGKPNRRTRRSLIDMQQREQLRERLIAIHDGTASPETTPEQDAANEWRDYLEDLDALPAWMPFNDRGFVSRADLMAAYEAEFGEDLTIRPADLYRELDGSGWAEPTKLRGVRGFRVVADDEDDE